MKLKVKRKQANLLVAVIKLPAITQQDGHSKIAPDLCLLAGTAKHQSATFLSNHRPHPKIAPRSFCTKKMLIQYANYNNRKYE
jgi:hypothetical protein